MGKIVYRLGVSIVCICVATSSLATQTTKKTTPERAEAKQLGEELATADKAGQDKALARLNELLDKTG